mgnify:CR=1 FL=1
MRILCIGDVVGSVGCEFLRKKLPAIKKVKGIDFVICNGENSSDGNGITPTTLPVTGEPSGTFALNVILCFVQEEPLCFEAINSFVPLFICHLHDVLKAATAKQSLYWCMAAHCRRSMNQTS